MHDQKESLKCVECGQVGSHLSNCQYHMEVDARDFEALKSENDILKARIKNYEKFMGWYMTAGSRSDVSLNKSDGCRWLLSREEYLQGMRFFGLISKEEEVVKKPDLQPIIHKLKCWPEYFSAISSGDKTFDIRQGNDRQYNIGDMLHLQEYDPKTRTYTERALLRRVTYVMHGGPFLPEDTWVLGLAERISNELL